MLQHPDLCKHHPDPTKVIPLVSDQVMGGVLLRLSDRLSGIKAQYATMTIGDKMADTVHDMYKKDNSGVMMTGTRFKKMCLAMAIALRDLAYTEVSSCILAFKFINRHDNRTLLSYIVTITVISYYCSDET